MTSLAALTGLILHHHLCMCVCVVLWWWLTLCVFLCVSVCMRTYVGPMCVLMGVCVAYPVKEVNPDWTDCVYRDWSSMTIGGIDATTAVGRWCVICRLCYYHPPPPPPPHHHHHHHHHHRHVIITVVIFLRSPSIHHHPRFDHNHHHAPLFQVLWRVDTEHLHWLWTEHQWSQCCMQSNVWPGPSLGSLFMHCTPLPQ